jgi:hypothetical protein
MADQFLMLYDVIADKFLNLSLLYKAPMTWQQLKTKVVRRLDEIGRHALATAKLLPLQSIYALEIKSDANNSSFIVN